MLTVQPFVQTDSPVANQPTVVPPGKPDMTAPRLVLKQAGTMVMVNPRGLMPRHPDQALGMIVDDTRGLQEFDIRLNGLPLLFVDGSADCGYAGIFHYGNSSFADFEPHSIKVEGGFVIDAGDLFYRLTLRNTATLAANLDLEISYAAGFQDTFEVRGSDRKQRGSMQIPLVLDHRTVRLAYVGLDQVYRSVQLQFAGQTPTSLSGCRATFSSQLQPGEEREYQVRISYRRGEGARIAVEGNWNFSDAESNARHDFENWLLGNAGMETSDPTLNKVLQRAIEDINMLRLGPLGIAAGLPQFAVPFGRDSAITGLQTCWLMPSLSRSIILALASRQGTKYDAITAEEPGKIMHELRTGEMVNTGEAPFGPYYGTVDATQLWLMLLVEYTRWTGDISLTAELWNEVAAGVSFLRRRSRRGFITYGGRPGEALANQCWKDSYNSIMYSDGELAVAPIAVCEAQGYMYAAFVGIATLADKLGKRSYARNLRTRASSLKKAFQKHFWMPKLGFVALALDKNFRQCDVISSNPGHLLGLGILTRRQERLVAQRLMQPDMFNGWFIRTLASSEVAYDESDYQRGSGWPHDNGLACVGMRTIGHDEDAIKVFSAHVDIASAASDFRLHELYCGNARTPESRHPTHYKVACVPQAWAAGSILHMMRACLNPGITNGALLMVNPQLPDWLPTVTISRLKVGNDEVDLRFTRDDDGKTICTVVRNENKVKIAIKSHVGVGKNAR